MSRRRYISTDMSIDKRLNRLAVEHGDFAALLYTWMVPHAADDATLNGDVDELIVTVIPHRRDKSAADVQDALMAMCSIGLIQWNGETIYFPVEAFYRYQTYIPAEKRRIADFADERRETPQNTDERRETPKIASSPSPSPSPSPSVTPSGSGADAPASVPSRTSKRLRPETDVTDDYLKEIQPRHPTVDVREVFADASNRKVWDGYKNQRRALSKYIGWAEEKAAERRNHATNRNGPAPAAAVQPWLQPGAREAADEARRQRIESRPADWYEKERERELRLARGES